MSCEHFSACGERNERHHRRGHIESARNPLFSGERQLSAQKNLVDEPCGRLFACDRRGIAFLWPL
jgi:hypothetical protein